ncbi:MAG: 50S ribosomal protein L9 [Trichlorobacter sp.]|jgi:large subunit ribosomal protein L9|nr:50S ribosomal protein L9 [Trichlorobacter sp.]
MKVILQENIDNLGQIGDIVKVAPGYARNYLLPKGFAIAATEKNAKALEHAKRQLAYKKNKAIESAKNMAEKLSAVIVNLTVNAGEDGKLFGSVTNMDIADFLKNAGFEIDRKKIIMPEAIKQIGEHSVSLKVHPEVSATIKVVVAAT